MDDQANSEQKLYDDEKPLSVRATRNRSLEGGEIGFVIGGRYWGWPEVVFCYKAIAGWRY